MLSSTSAAARVLNLHSLVGVKAYVWYVNPLQSAYHVHTVLHNSRILLPSRLYAFVVCQAIVESGVFFHVIVPDEKNEYVIIQTHHAHASDFVTGYQKCGYGIPTLLDYSVITVSH